MKLSARQYSKNTQNTNPPGAPRAATHLDRAARELHELAKSTLAGNVSRRLKTLAEAITQLAGAADRLERAAMSVGEQ